jgi:hypothetical protein
MSVEHQHILRLDANFIQSIPKQPGKKERQLALEAILHGFPKDWPIDPKSYVSQLAVQKLALLTFPGLGPRDEP